MEDDAISSGTAGSVLGIFEFFLTANLSAIGIDSERREYYRCHLYGENKTWYNTVILTWDNKSKEYSIWERNGDLQFYMKSDLCLHQQLDLRWPATGEIFGSINYSCMSDKHGVVMKCVPAFDGTKSFEIQTITTRGNCGELLASVGSHSQGQLNVCLSAPLDNVSKAFILCMTFRLALTTYQLSSDLHQLMEEDFINIGLSAKWDSVHKQPDNEVNSIATVVDDPKDIPPPKVFPNQESKGLDVLTNVKDIWFKKVARISNPKNAIILVAHSISNEVMYMMEDYGSYIQFTTCGQHAMIFHARMDHATASYGVFMPDSSRIGYIKNWKIHQDTGPIIMFGKKKKSVILNMPDDELTFLVYKGNSVDKHYRPAAQITCDEVQGFIRVEILKIHINPEECALILGAALMAYGQVFHHHLAVVPTIDNIESLTPIIDATVATVHAVKPLQPPVQRAVIVEGLSGLADMTNVKFYKVANVLVGDSDFYPLLDSSSGQLLYVMENNLDGGVKFSLIDASLETTTFHAIDVVAIHDNRTRVYVADQLIGYATARHGTFDINDVPMLECPQKTSDQAHPEPYFVVKECAGEGKAPCTISYAPPFVTITMRKDMDVIAKALLLVETMKLSIQYFRACNVAGLQLEERHHLIPTINKIIEEGKPIRLDPQDGGRTEGFPKNPGTLSDVHNPVESPLIHDQPPSDSVENLIKNDWAALGNMKAFRLEKIAHIFKTKTDVYKLISFAENKELFLLEFKTIGGFTVEIVGLRSDRLVMRCSDMLSMEEKSTVYDSKGLEIGYILALNVFGEHDRQLMYVREENFNDGDSDKTFVVYQHETQDEMCRIECYYNLHYINVRGRVDTNASSNALIIAFALKLSCIMGKMNTVLVPVVSEMESVSRMLGHSRLVKRAEEVFGPQIDEREYLTNMNDVRLEKAALLKSNQLDVVKVVDTLDNSEHFLLEFKGKTADVLEIKGIDSHQVLYSAKNMKGMEKKTMIQDSYANSFAFFKLYNLYDDTSKLIMYAIHTNLNRNDNCSGLPLFDIVNGEGKQSGADKTVAKVEFHRAQRYIHLRMNPNIDLRRRVLIITFAMKLSCNFIDMDIGYKHAPLAYFSETNGVDAKAIIY